MIPKVDNDLLTLEVETQPNSNGNANNNNANNTNGVCFGFHKESGPT